MENTRQPDPTRLARQCLESLKAAGVEWLPIANTSLTSEPDPMARSKEQPAAESFVTTVAPVQSDGGLTLEQRRVELKLLAQRVSTCERCPELCSTRTQTVFGVGDAGVELCFVGEAPGADEDAQGEPFVGAAGQLLNRIIAACGLKREEVYICNTIKCRPPGNRTPLPNERANCREFFDRQLELVKPKFICALGTSAAQNLLGVTTSLGGLRGRFHDYRGTPVLVTYHPAFLLPHRSPQKKKDVWDDMKMLLAKMGRPVPAKN
jgi:DNA polymerase